MIVTVTPNPALDITYHLRAPLGPGRVNRVDAVSERAGGKGVNVARVLAANRVDVCALGLIGGATGVIVESLLAAAGVAHDLTTIAGTTRRTVVVAAGSGEVGATGLWEPGPVVTVPEWDRLRATYRSYLGKADAVVLAGSLPPGVPAHAYGDLIGLANAAGVPVILDADGAALRAGLAARPAVTKPNAQELAAAVGLPVIDVGSAIVAARRAQAAGARDVVVSLGSAGLVAVTGDRAWAARPPGHLPGNATGAGDAAVAALAVGTVARESWPARLVRAVAWSAAAVTAPVAGEFSAELAGVFANGIYASEIEVEAETAGRVPPT